MNCQEVMDLMQRQLDGDLDVRETELLMTHLRHCPECSAMLERLKLLSAGLDNLPKVTPSYSLVDAILPRLAEIQKAGEAGSGDDAVRSEPIEVVLPLRRTEKEPNAEQPRRRSRFSLRAIGGVVAAGIVVGLLLATHPFDSFNNRLGDADSAADSTTTADSSAADTGTNLRTFAALKEDPASEADTSKGQEKEKVSSDAANDGAAPGTDHKAADSDNPAVKEQSGGSDTGTAPSADSSTMQDKNAAADSAQGDSGSSDKSLSPNYEISGGSTGSGAGGKEEDPAAGGKQPLPAAGGSAPDAGGAPAESGDMAASFAPAVPEATSPDQRYKAAVVDSSLKIYRVEDNVLIFESDKRPAGIRSLSWTKDSKTFTYETTSGDGKTVVYAVDPETQSEQIKTE